MDLRLQTRCHIQSLICRSALLASASPVHGSACYSDQQVLCRILPPQCHPPAISPIHLLDDPVKGELSWLPRARHGHCHTPARMLRFLVSQVSCDSVLVQRTFDLLCISVWDWLSTAYGHVTQPRSLSRWCSLNSNCDGLHQ